MAQIRIKDRQPMDVALEQIASISTRDMAEVEALVRKNTHGTYGDCFVRLSTMYHATDDKSQQAVIRDALAVTRLMESIKGAQAKHSDYVTVGNLYQFRADALKIADENVKGREGKTDISPRHGSGLSIAVNELMSNWGHKDCANKAKEVLHNLPAGTLAEQSVYLYRAAEMSKLNNDETGYYANRFALAAVRRGTYIDQQRGQGVQFITAIDHNEFFDRMYTKASRLNAGGSPEELDLGQGQITKATKANNAPEAQAMIAKAQGGDVAAMREAGMHMADGSAGFAKDPARGFKFTMNAAEKNDPVAQYNMGIAYKNGIGVAKNPELAAAYFVVAANNGVERAKGQMEAMGAQLTEAQATSANRRATHWMETHAHVPPTTTTPQTGDPAPGAGAGDTSTTTRRSTRSWTHIDSDIQFSLEKMLMAAGDEAKALNTGNKNRAAMLRGETAMDEKRGDRTNAAIEWFKTKHPELKDKSEPEIFAAIKTEGAKVAAPAKQTASAPATDGQPAPAAPATDLKTALATQLAAITDGDRAINNLEDSNVVSAIAAGKTTEEISASIKESTLTFLRQAGVSEAKLGEISQTLTVENGVVKSDVLRGVEHAIGVNEDGIYDKRLAALFADAGSKKLIVDAINQGSITAVAKTDGVVRPGTPAASPSTETAANR
ncbi:MAG: tetratricopeptide repeat protein [Rickettsiales bacterium]